MKHLKLFNEGLFSDKEIPKRVIDDIVSELKTKYKDVFVIDLKKQKDIDRGILDRKKIAVGTTIGNIDIVLSLLNPDKKTYGGSSRLISKVKNFKAEFTSPIIQITSYHNKTMIGVVDKIKDIKNFGIGKDYYPNFSEFIDKFIVDTNKKTKAKKEYYDFYEKVTSLDIKDIFLDISDTIGDFTINKVRNLNLKGYNVTFDKTNLKKYSVNVPGSGTNRWHTTKFTSYVPDDRMVSIISDLNVAYKRLDEIYKMDMSYLINDGILVVTILERKIH